MKPANQKWCEFKRYRDKNDDAMENYFWHADNQNFKRADYWLRVARKWARKMTDKFTEYCPD